MTVATEVNTIELWQPRWRDKVLLIAKYKVQADNRIVFTKEKSMPGEYYLSGETIKKYPVESNGKIPCYAVHMDELTFLEDK